MTQETLIMPPRCKTIQVTYKDMLWFQQQATDKVQVECQSDQMCTKKLHPSQRKRLIQANANAQEIERLKQLAMEA